MNITLDFGDHLLLEPGIKLRLRVPPLTDKQLVEVCARNDIWRFEREPDGELTVEICKGGTDGQRILKLNLQIWEWDRTHQKEKGLIGSNCGFFLPNGAMRAPITFWASPEQKRSLTREEREGFPRFSPYFVAEMRTMNLRLDELDRKMREYLKCGSRLGLLFDPDERTVYVYRPDADVEILHNPAHVSCEPEMPELTLKMEKIFSKA